MCVCVYHPRSKRAASTPSSGNSLIGKAVARVVRNTPSATGIYDALVAMFPTGDLPAAQGVGPTSPEVRGQLVACARKLLARWPSRAAPGPNGSRFEHWGAVTQEVALGVCSHDFLEANLGARIFALRKPNGKLRPIA